MKKIVFFLALFSFSMGCFAQQDYEKEINELTHIAAAFGEKLKDS